jgi:hypothetical protein
MSYQAGLKIPCDYSRKALAPVTIPGNPPIKKATATVSAISASLAPRERARFAILATPSECPNKASQSSIIKVFVFMDSAPSRPIACCNPDICLSNSGALFSSRVCQLTGLDVVIFIPTPSPLVAAERGFEPRQTDSKSAVLPLHNSAFNVLCRRSGSNRHEGCPPMVFETIASACSATSA